MENEFSQMYGTYVGITLNHSIRIPVFSQVPVSNPEEQTYKQRKRRMRSEFHLEDVIGAQGFLKSDTEGFVYLEGLAFFKEDGVYLRGGKACISKSDISAMFDIPANDEDLMNANALRESINLRDSIENR
jgi:hypothetical protein